MTMTIVFDNIPMMLETTKAGGRIISTIRNGKVHRVYTHPSRSKSVKRLERDVQKVANAANGVAVLRKS